MAGDLSTQRFNRDKYLSLITAGSPARDDDSGGQHTVISKGEKMTKTTAPRPHHFDESGAERRNLTALWYTPQVGRRSLGSAFH